MWQGRSSGGREDQWAEQTAGVHAAYRRYKSSLETGRIRQCRPDLEKREREGRLFVPGEHDVLNDDGKSYLERYGKNAKGAWMYTLIKRRALIGW